MSDKIQSELLIKLNRFREDQEFFDRTDLLPKQILASLYRILMTYDFYDEDYDFLRAMACALEKRHSRYFLDVVPIPEGQTTDIRRSFARQQKAHAIADFIDAGVADGKKQDAMVREAEKRWKASRRDIFRYLSEVRKWRLENVQSFAWPPYGPEYEISSDGKLVPVVPGK